MTDKLNELLDKGPVAINMGVKDFAASLEIQGVEIIQVDWVPPAGGDAELIALLDKLL